MYLFLRKRPKDFSVRILLELRFCCFGRFKPESATAKSLGNSKISRNSKISVPTRFEQKNLRARTSCPDPQRLPFKGSLLLQNLIGPGYLQLPS